MIKNDRTVEVQRNFHAPAAKIFDAIGQGILLRKCGADPETLRVDFRAGGEFHAVFGKKHVLTGKFLQVDRPSLIRFSWGNEGEVTIRLRETNGVTHMHLLHENIPTAELARDIDWGWRDGVNDFTPEVTRKFQVTRTFAAPLAKVYDLFAGPKLFGHVGASLETGKIDFRVGGQYDYRIVDGCGSHDGKSGEDTVKGEFTDIIANKRIAFTWNSFTVHGPSGETLVAVDFKEESPGQTRVTITHSSLPSETYGKVFEEGWTAILQSL